MTDSIRQLEIAPLTPESFAPFGDVIQTQTSEYFMINNGSTKRFHDLALVDVEDGGGRAILSIFEAKRLDYPLEIQMMERHPLGSQAFVPLLGQPFLIVVAPKTEQLDPSQIKAFYSDGSQGVNYHKGVWHHPVLALTDNDKFLIADRKGNGKNCDEVFLQPEDFWSLDLASLPFSTS